jgi:hypothetical protein
MRIATYAGIIIITAAATFSDAQTSNVQTVRGWRRTHVIGVSGGSLLDASGTIASQQRLSAAQAMNNASTQLVSAASAGLTNALLRLYSAASHTNDYTGRLFIASDLEEDPGYSNILGAVVGETVSNDGTLHYFVHYNKELHSAPKTIWEFNLSEIATQWSIGTSTNETTNFNGYACYDISVKRPDDTWNYVLRAKKFMLFGSPSIPLALSDAGLELIVGSLTNRPFTGSDVYTDGTHVVTDTYLSGLLYTSATNFFGDNQ